MKILFASPYCLLDNTSGAAISMRTLLAGVHRAGHQAIAYGATIFDSQIAAERAPKPPFDPKQRTLFTLDVDGVRHVLLPTPHWRRALMYAADEEFLAREFKTLLKQYQPDAVITYGGMLLERHFLSHARSHGVLNIFYLVNPGYYDLETFKDVDLIVTDSQATADLYRERLGLCVNVIGHMIDPSAYIITKRQPQTVTFVNPSLEKGVSMVARLALMCQNKFPDLRFLVVQSRGQWCSSLQRIGLCEQQFPNVDLVPMQLDMRLIYKQTKILIAPSFWHESGGRVAFEAMLNGIPTMIPTHGGIGELLNGGGIMLEIPEAVRNYPEQLVSETQAAIWFNTLQSLLEDQFSFSVATAKARSASRNFSLEQNVNRFEQYVQSNLFKRLGVVPSLLTDC